jgi:RluA family pseudouridine synthase
VILRHLVTADESGRELKSIVRREMGISAALLIQLKYSGGLVVNGKAEFSNYRTAEGDAIELDVTASEPDTDVPAEDGDVDILMEDEWLIAVNKPSGVLVHPSRAKFTGTVQNFLLGYLKRTGQRLICHAVNRLDRDTSGVVLFAKSGYAKDRLTRALASSTAVKEYIALTAGHFEPGCGTIDAPIRRVEEGNMRRAVLPDGQRAVTHYETLERAGEYSLMGFTLETGRTHQIRVHCLYSGCPILGDRLYFTENSREISERLGLTAQALHAEKLKFIHPATGEPIELIAPVKREDLRRVLESFGR